MATIKFSINLSGGYGNIHIHIIGSSLSKNIDLDQTTPSQILDLPPDTYSAGAGGNVPNSPSGAINLLITAVSGNISPSMNHNFTGAGAITPFPFSFDVS